MTSQQTLNALSVWADKGWADEESVEKVSLLVEQAGEVPGLDFVVSKFGKRGMKVAWIEGGAIVQICAEPAPRDA